MKHTFKNLLGLTLGVCLLVGITSCEALAKMAEDDGPILTETRQVGSFTKLRVSSFLDVYVTQGSAISVEVKASESLMEDITTEVKNGTLVIDYDKNTWNMGNVTAKVYVTVTELSSIDASGSSDVVIESDITAGDFEIEASGSSDVVCKNYLLKVNDLVLHSSGASDIVINDLLARDIKADASGSSDIEVGGEATSVDVETDGSSDFTGKNLQVAHCVAHSSGSSDILIRVSDTFEGKASGASDITYYGSPTVHGASTSGSADINQRSE